MAFCSILQNFFVDVESRWSAERWCLEHWSSSGWSVDMHSCRRHIACQQLCLPTSVPVLSADTNTCSFPFLCLRHIAWRHLWQSTSLMDTLHNSCRQRSLHANTFCVPASAVSSPKICLFMYILNHNVVMPAKRIFLQYDVGEFYDAHRQEFVLETNMKTNSWTYDFVEVSGHNL